MTLDRDVYFEVRFRAMAMHFAQAKVRLLQAEADLRTREYVDLVARLELDPSKAYRFDDDTLTLTEILDATPDRNG